MCPASQREDAIREYLHDVAYVRSEAARAERFAVLLSAQYLVVASLNGTRRGI
jgi:hypothetical protein